MSNWSAAMPPRLASGWRREVGTAAPQAGQAKSVSERRDGISSSEILIRCEQSGQEIFIG
jgi:hypothetical protein